MSEDATSNPPQSVHQHGEPNAGNELNIRNDDVARDRRVRIVKLFLKLYPPSFAGVEGPEAAEEFLKRAEKIFILLECSPAEKVLLATYSLQKEADDWWNVTMGTIDAEYPGDEWQRFRQAFLDKYFPFFVREEKAREFDVLVQTEDMTVVQYEAKFSKLSKYAPEMVNTQEKRLRKFERGLLPEIQNVLAVQMITNYRELYWKAQMVEKTQRECNEMEMEMAMERKSGPGSTSRSMKRGRFLRRGGSSGPVPRYSGYDQGATMMSAPSQPPLCTRCGKWHSGGQCRGSVTCYQCGQTGHVQRNCPQN